MHKPAVIFLGALPRDWPDRFPGCSVHPLEDPDGEAYLSELEPPVAVVADEEEGVRAVSHFLGGSAPASGAPSGGTTALLSRLRHSVNNALTSALAETQFALMCDMDEEVRSSLTVVEAQLKIIRDAVAATRPSAVELA